MFLSQRSRIILTIALRNFQRRFKKNLMVVLLIAVGVAVFCLGSAIIQRSTSGVRAGFVDRCTADLSISVRSDLPFSIFGSDLPVIGDFEKMPLLKQGAAIDAILSGEPALAAYAYQITIPCLLGYQDFKEPVLGFGVLAQEYFRTFPDIEFMQGGVPADNDAWVVMGEDRRQRIESSQGHPIRVGDTLQISMFQNQTFAIRDVRLAGVIKDTVRNEALSRIILLDAGTAATLVGVESNIIPYDDIQGSGIPASPDDVFAEGWAGTGSLDASDDDIASTSLAELLSAGNVSTGPATAPGHEAAWHFILLRLRDSATAGLAMERLESAFRASGIEVQLRDWRGTAGAVATYVFIMQAVFYIGLLIIAVVILMIVMNSLVVSVLERTAEIGTMRAMGAGKGFVSALFIVETMVVCTLAGITGVASALVAGAILNALALPLNNDLLSLVFGGKVLGLDFTARIAAAAFTAALCLGAVSWIFPVRMALAIQPVKAIQKG